MSEYDTYFDKNEILEFKLWYPCKKSALITELRKIGDEKNQYVINVYYLDVLSFSYDKAEIYSKYNDDESPIYSYYHSDCDFCKEHKQKVKKNLVVGYKIYPKGIKPEKTYKEKKIYWEQFI